MLNFVARKQRKVWSQWNCFYGRFLSSSFPLHWCVLRVQNGVKVAKPEVGVSHDWKGDSWSLMLYPFNPKEKEKSSKWGEYSRTLPMPDIGTEFYWLWICHLVKRQPQYQTYNKGFVRQTEQELPVSQSFEGCHWIQMSPFISVGLWWDWPSHAVQDKGYKSPTPGNDPFSQNPI